MLIDMLKEMRLPAGLRDITESVVGLLPASPKHEKLEKEVEAYCTTCDRITAQRAVWVGRIMKGRQCVKCGLVTKPDPALLGRCYVEEVLARAAAKPESLRRETWGHRLLYAPFRIVTKSLEEGRYVADLILDEREWVNSPHQRPAGSSEK
ncbi:MAG: hypothetical protein V2A58_18040 [Planctomycetota bacterium]